MTEHDNQPQEATEAQESEGIVDSVRELIVMMNQGGIGELDLKTANFKIRLRSEAVALAAAAPIMSMPPAYAMSPMPGMSHNPGPDQGNATAAVEETAVKDGHEVTSPMIGTFYSASAPGEPAYVRVGDEVETGQVIGIIEAMKIMNEITADKSGVVTDILVENAQPVEYGSPLIRISNTMPLD